MVGATTSFIPKKNQISQMKAIPQTQKLSMPIFKTLLLSLL